MTQDLTKDDFIHQRGEDNQLLPRRVELQTLKPENIKESSVSFDLTTDDDGDLVEAVSVKVKPAKPGQLNELQVDLQEVQLDRPEDMTSEIYEWVVDYLVEPDLDGTDAETPKGHREHPDWVYEVEDSEGDISIKDRLKKRAFLMEKLGLSFRDLNELTYREQDDLIKGFNLNAQERQDEIDSKTSNIQN